MASIQAVLAYGLGLVIQGNTANTTFVLREVTTQRLRGGHPTHGKEFSELHVLRCQLDQF
jgi:hypothetical protein